MTKKWMNILYGLLLTVMVAGCSGPPVPAPSGTPPAPSPWFSDGQPPSDEPLGTEAPGGEYRKIASEEAKKMIEAGGVIVVDVRTRVEYDQGHIQEALLIPNETISGAPPAELPQKDATILVYCRSGRRSREAAHKLLALGYTNVHDFGGIQDWPYETVSGE